MTKGLFRGFSVSLQGIIHKNYETNNNIICCPGDSYGQHRTKPLCADLVHQRPCADGTQWNHVCLHRPRRGQRRLLLDAGMACLFHTGHGQLAGPRFTPRLGEFLLGRRPCLGLANHRTRWEVLLVYLCPLEEFQWHGHRCSRQRLAHGSFP